MHTNYANVSTNFTVDQKQSSKSTMKCSWKVQTISGQAFLKQFAQVVCPVLKREVHISLCIYQVDNEYDLKNTWEVKTS